MNDDTIKSVKNIDYFTVNNLKLKLFFCKKNSIFVKKNVEIMEKKT